MWEHLLDKFEKDENMYLLVMEEGGKVVSSVQMAIIESLTHNVRPFAVIENVVTHADTGIKDMRRHCWKKHRKSPGNTDVIRFFWKPVQIKKVP